MTTPSRAAIPGAPGARQLSRYNPPTVSYGSLLKGDLVPLRYVAEMYALQIDQIATLLTDWGEPAESATYRARELVARWRAAGYAACEELTLGEPWVWATRAGLEACDIQTTLVKPGLPTLRHTRAVTEVRLMMDRSRAHRRSNAEWWPERLLLAGEFPARMGHAPDAEVRNPPGSGAPWAGEIWAIEVELSRKSVPRIASIMEATLNQAADFRRLPGSYPIPGHLPRYARILYLCSPDAFPSAVNAHKEIGPPQAGRIAVRELPSSALRLRVPKRTWP